MKNIMVVVDDINESKMLFNKAAQLASDSITVLLTDSEYEAEINEQLSVINQKNDTESNAFILFAASKQPSNKVAELILAKSKECQADLILLRKPNLIEHPKRIEFIKELLRGADKTKLLFCKNTKWKKSPDLLCTLDMSDESSAQKELNVVAYNYGAKTLCPVLQAKLHLGTIIAVSRIGQELDVIEPVEVLLKHKTAYRDKLVQFEQQQSGEGANLHVGAGVPAKELPSMANKIKADIVVMGNVGRKGLKGLVIGNTAEKIFKYLYSDIVVVSNN